MENKLVQTTGSVSTQTLEYIRQAQNLVHHQLDEFLGFWPWNKSYHPKSWCSVDALRSLLNESLKKENSFIMGNLGLPRFHTTLKQLIPESFTKNVGRTHIAEVLCSFYNEFETLKYLPVEPRLTKPICPVFDPKTYPSTSQRYLRPFVKLQEILRKNQDKFLGAYLFGSYATQDFIPGWSDADILFVLSPRCFESPFVLLETRQLIIELQKFLFQIDPLQLHGFFILTWADLKWYPQYFFPFVLFEYSLSLLDSDKPFDALQRGDEVERKNIFQDQAKYFINLAASDALPITHVQRKLFFHKVFTFPLYFLQAQGIHCYKKYSFEIARNIRPEFNWSCLDKPTSWMRTCPNKIKLEMILRNLSGMHPYIGAYTLQSSLYHFVHRLRLPLWQVSPSELRKLITEMAQLAKSCISYLHA